VIVELHIGTSLQVFRAVLNGSADLGFVEGDSMSLSWFRSRWSSINSS
jgi:hypothetical protein